MPRRALVALVLLIALASLSGCASLHYLSQAGAGQLDISLRARSLREVVGDPDTPLRIRRLLLRVGSVKRFGERHGLIPTGNYASYTALDRPVAVWVVSASEPLRFKKRTWSFPIVGSVPYLGWFRRQDARDFAAGLRREGLDVDVRGASAYSTLGWFEDPVLSTMIEDGDEALGELANTVLHESVHATLYIEGQSILNESIANFVGDRLAALYLDEEVGPNSAEKRAYLEAQEASLRRARAMHAAYQALDRLYASSRPRQERLAEKRRILAALEREVEAKRPINNATLLQFKAYNTGQQELEVLLEACGGSIRRLMDALEGLDAGDFSKSQQEDLAAVLLPLARAGCPAAGGELRASSAR